MAKKKAASTNPALGNPLLTGDLKSKVDQVSGGGLVSQVNPELRNRIGASQQDLTQQYQRQVLPGLSRAAEGAGRFGSDAYQMAQGEAATGLTRALGDIESNMQFQDYNARMQDMMQGLGLGTNLYGIDSQAESQRQAAAQAASSQAAAIAAQQSMQQQELQFKAAQAMQQGDLATMEMMLNAANQMGGMQQNALGNLPGIDQMGGMGFLGNLLGQSTGLDNAAINAILQGQQQQNQFQLGQQGLGLQQQGLNLQQQQQQYGQQMDAFGWGQQNPWDQLNAYGNLVNGLMGQYGTTSSQGHQTTPYMGPSPIGGAISGLIGGASMGSGFGGGGGGGPRYSNNASGNYWSGNPW
jgi:hypothetical protein